MVTLGTLIPNDLQFIEGRDFKPEEIVKLERGVSQVYENVNVQFSGGYVAMDLNRIDARKRVADAIVAAVSSEPLTYQELCSVLESVKALTAPAPSPSPAA